MYRKPCNGPTTETTTRWAARYFSGTPTQTRTSRKIPTTYAMTRYRVRAADTEASMTEVGISPLARVVAHTSLGIGVQPGEHPVVRGKFVVPVVVRRPG